MVDWVSDSEDENPGSDSNSEEAKPSSSSVSGTVAGSPKLNWISDSDENLDDGWDTDDAKPTLTSDLDSVPLKESSEAGPSRTNWTAHFVAMGFPEKLVTEAIEKNREGDTEGVLETLLTYGAIERSPNSEDSPAHCPLAGAEDVVYDDSSDMEGFEFEDYRDDFSEKDKIVSTLVDMGFLAEEASSAIDRCGPSASILELADSVRAAQMQEDSGDELWVCPGLSDGDESCGFGSFKEKKRRRSELVKKNKRTHLFERKTCVKKMRPFSGDDLAPIVIPKPMIGFGLPHQRPLTTHRKLPESAIGPPFFYYENVSNAPKGVWDTISRFLYDIEPEFVDSKFFSATARKRGYIHNLPINNRFPLLPIPPKTIHEAFPLTKKWWPSWDTRTHLNCIQTCISSAKLGERIRLALSQSSDPPPLSVQKYVMYECRKWNLVWVGVHKVAPLEPDEIEMLLGFPRNHTRGIARTERYKSLGNSFQVDTVAFHLSVLKDMFPNGMTVLSLFSGIGGAEIALHRLGIRLKTVVSVELSESNRNLMRCWWEQTRQTGTLIDIADVQSVNGDKLEHLISTYGGFDLVIGGSPCNNLAGSNRHHRDGLEGKQSSLFYDYFRILDLVKCIMGK